MRYPIISLSECDDWAEKKMEGLDPTVEEVWVGQGEAIDLASIEGLAADVVDRISSLSHDVDRDQVEGKIASELHKVLSDLPTEVLDDPGFWRYLSVKHFWSFIEWREKEPIEKGNHQKYLNGRSNTEAVLPRMYLRAKAVGSDHLELAGKLEGSTDFWRSHILRVRTGSAPALTRSFVRMQSDDRMMTSRLREFARSVNRLWSNIELHTYTDVEAAELISEVKSEMGVD